MATLKNESLLEAAARECLVVHTKDNQSRNGVVPQINEDYINQVSEEMEARMTEKLCEKTDRTLFFALSPS